MPGRSPARPRSVRAANGPGTISPGLNSNPMNTTVGQTAVFRHQFTQGATYKLASTLIAQQEYAILDLLKFERSFGGAVLDNPPTPVLGTNNYTSTKVWNNSIVGNYNCNIILRNETPDTPVYLDVYMISVSFDEAYVWNQYWTAACPISMASVALGGVNAGRVDTKTPAVGLVDRQTIQDSNFLKRFIKPLGTITVPAAGAGGVAEVNFNTVPPKCRRSNYGMYWGVAFANDALKNQGDKAVRIIGTYDFEEIPSSTRNTQFPG